MDIKSSIFTRGYATLLVKIPLLVFIRYFKNMRKYPLFIFHVKFSITPLTVQSGVSRKSASLDRNEDHSIRMAVYKENEYILSHYKEIVH